MASVRGDMKGFYRQKKKTSTSIGGGISKQSKKPATSFPSGTGMKRSPVHSATLGSDAVQPPALISHGSLDLQEDRYDDKNELILKEFDMNLTYGPCLGISRMDRWERAVRLGMNPPKEVESLLSSGKCNDQCLWDGRV